MEKQINSIPTKVQLRKIDERVKELKNQIKENLAFQISNIYPEKISYTGFVVKNLEVEEFLNSSENLEELLLKLALLRINKVYGDNKFEYLDLIKKALKNWYKKNKENLKYTNLELFLQKNKPIFERFISAFRLIYKKIKQLLKNKKDVKQIWSDEFNQFVDSYYHKQNLDQLVNDILTFFEVVKNYLDRRISEEDYKKYFNWLLKRLQTNYVHFLLKEASKNFKMSYQISGGR